MNMDMDMEVDISHRFDNSVEWKTTEMRMDIDKRPI